MQLHIKRNSISPAPPSPTIAGRNQQFFTTFPLQPQPQQYYSNKIQFLQQPQNCMPFVQVQSQVKQRICTEERSSERYPQRVYPQSMVQPLRQQQDEKENQSTTDSRSVPLVFQAYFQKQLLEAKEQWKQEVIEEFKLANQVAVCPCVEMIDQIQYFLEQQKQFTESETIQKILKEEFTIHSIFQIKNDIITKVVSLEEKIEKQVENQLGQSFPTYEECLSIVDSKLNEKLQNHDVLIRSLQDKLKEQHNQQQPQLFQQLLQKQEDQFEKYKYNQEDQILLLKDQIAELKYSVQRQSMIKSQTGEDFEYSYRQKQPIDQYDQYIKKYESFNRQVSDYLQNRQIPEHLQSFVKKKLFCMFQIQSYNQANEKQKDINDLPLQVPSSRTSKTHFQGPSNEINKNFNSNDQRKNSELNLSQESYSSKSIQKLSPNSKGESEGSPIRNLHTMFDRMSPQRQSIELTKEETQKVRSEYKCQMSAITEREIEDDEVVYQVDENGYLMDEKGQLILDEDGNTIKLSEQQIQNFRNARLDFIEDDQTTQE